MTHAYIYVAIGHARFLARKVYGNWRTFGRAD